ncbi:MAG: hypothetical protein HQK89_12395 [Nitrospirae bacterium]|nr:hypothetical protein [Nitrospirota bacterium]
MRGGFHYEVMELLRSITESADLIVHFMSGNDANPDLKKWFAGKTISNAETRKAMHDLTNEKLDKPGVIVPMGDMKASIYSNLSLYIHISYAALLESYSVFSKDFDFDRVVGFHRVQAESSLYAQEVMEVTIMALEFFYKRIGDNESQEKLYSIFKSYIACIKR